jgi:hypothetical protein
MSKPNAKPAKPDALATLKKLQAKDPGLKRLLEKAYGYAVFPAVGKANLVVGGAFGRGEVFEKGKKIGYATISLLTIGVQIGGDTFDEVVVFESKEALERFKRGKTAFSANASAVLVKAGAASAKDFEKGAAVYVYPHGGMMLELGIGGQRFRFKPADEEQGQGGKENTQQSGKAKDKGAQGKSQQEDEGEGEEQDEGEEGEESEEGEEQASGGNRALELAGRAVGGVRTAATKATEMVKRHPVAATVAGVGLAAGLGLLIARAMRGSGSEEGEEDQDAGGEEEEQDEGAQDSAEDSDEGEGDEDEGQEDEQDESGEGDEDRGILSRLMSRGKSRA